MSSSLFTSAGGLKNLWLCFISAHGNTSQWNFCEVFLYLMSFFPVITYFFLSKLSLVEHYLHFCTISVELDVWVPLCLTWTAFFFAVSNLSFDYSCSGGGWCTFVSPDFVSAFFFIQHLFSKFYFLPREGVQFLRKIFFLIWKSTPVPPNIKEI